MPRVKKKQETDVPARVTSGPPETMRYIKMLESKLLESHLYYDEENDDHDRDRDIESSNKAIEFLLSLTDKRRFRVACKMAQLLDSEFFDDLSKRLDSMSDDPILGQIAQDILEAFEDLDNDSETE